MACLSLRAMLRRFWIMPITPKHIGPIVGLALSLSASAFAQAPDQQPRSPGAPPSAQQPAAPPSSQAPGQQQKPAAQAQTARGEIASVDATAKMFTIKMSDGTEQKFRYSDETKVTGERGGVAGLGKMSGRQVVVHFNSQGADRVASEIEVQGAAGASPTPSQRPGGADDRTGGAGDRPGAPGAGAPGGDKPTPDK
jgi:hypothetical protein